MEKKISYLIYLIINVFDKILRLILNRSFLIWFPEFISKYKKIDNYVFFIPNKLIEWRIKTFYTKEPETLEWIDSFEKNSTFWDIGANIGLYSIYCGKRNKSTKIFSFEPSTSNLRVLSRNTYINELEKKITIVPMPLLNINGIKPFMMHESSFVEGEAENSFKVNFDWQGNKFNSANNYSLFGTSIDFLVENNILQLPDYIKIDVDGVEHFILEGSLRTLKNKKIKSILIELNEDFKEQFKTCNKILKDSGFKLLKKEHSQMFENSIYSNVYNHIFTR